MLDLALREQSVMRSLFPYFGILLPAARGQRQRVVGGGDGVASSLANPRVSE